MNKRYICIHGHFYQPPRENPWLEEVEMQDSAQPFHDWNERITVECYGPNASSRILDDQGRIVDIINNYSKISFNFGPTLLSWMERHHPDDYQAILAADTLSLKRFSGHGSALAQVYNHMIMPLANKRDKYTQALWGLEDFKSRFGRDPEGMWLPETAVDVETLEVLAELGIAFTILSPRQASQVRRMDKKYWMSVDNEKIDPTMPYLFNLPSGRSITIFFYDGPISRDLAFGDMLASGENFRNRLMAAFAENPEFSQLVHIATDGETYGHHHRHGEMALSYCLHLVESDDSIQLTNYGEYLDRYPPTFEAEIFEGSSWSCIHGVERWKEDCGCNSGMHGGWHQKWRQPLRQGVNWLSERAGEVYEEQAGDIFTDPWVARDHYIDVLLNRDQDNVDRFLTTYGISENILQDRTQALRLLELQRFGQLIFTSCGWFFDDISGIETVQILQYALKTLQLIEQVGGPDLEGEFVQILEKAPSNVHVNGGRVFEDFVKPAKVDMLRVGAHYAISSLFKEYPEQFDLGCYTVTTDNCEQASAGRSSLATGKAEIISRTTLEAIEVFFAALHLGDHNVTCGLNPFHDLDPFRNMQAELGATFERGDVTESIRTLDKYFTNTYSIFHLFRDEQHKVVHEILQQPYAAAESSFRQILRDNHVILNYLHGLNIRPPRQILTAAEYVVNIDLCRLFTRKAIDLQHLEELIQDGLRWSLDMLDENLRLNIGNWAANQLELLSRSPDDLDLMEMISSVLIIASQLPGYLDIWRAQNLFFQIQQKHLGQKKNQAAHDDRHAQEWLNRFTALGDVLKVKTT